MRRTERREPSEEHAEERVDVNNEFRACVVQAPHHELLPEEADVLVPVGRFVHVVEAIV